MCFGYLFNLRPTDRNYTFTYFPCWVGTLKGIIKFRTIFRFADNTLLSVSASIPVECIEKMQEDLDALSDWFKFNKLKLNVSKTKFMIITGKRSSATNRALLTIDGEQVQSMKTLVYKSTTNWPSKSI
jgi:hypothetical protein